jgi:hypothetical protein
LESRKLGRAADAVPAPGRTEAHSIQREVIVTKKQVKQLIDSLQIIAVCMVVLVGVGSGFSIGLIQNYFEEHHQQPTKPRTSAVQV